MAVYFETTDPQRLLNAFDAAIALDNSKGGIATWEKLPSGHYSHEASQWRRQAFFFPKIANQRLIFNIVPPQNGSISDVVYAYYHGHLIETMLRRFDRMFSLGSATALPDVNDQVN